jgi:cyanophycin synthetase
VIGDGVHTVTQLVDAVNADPRRGDGHATPLTRIRVDEIARARLGVQGLTPESVIEVGRRVLLRNNANLSTGGTATDATDEVHADVAASAVAAARMVGLHVCGVDVVCESVLQPLEAQSGGVVEVNAAPGLRMHLVPSCGKARSVGDAIIADLYAPGDDGRIPVIAIIGTNGETTVTRLIAQGDCGPLDSEEGLLLSRIQELCADVEQGEVAAATPWVRAEPPRRTRRSRCR